MGAYRTRSKGSAYEKCANKVTNRRILTAFDFIVSGTDAVTDFFTEAKPSSLSLLDRDHKASRVQAQQYVSGRLYLHDPRNVALSPATLTRPTLEPKFVIGITLS